MAYYEDSRYVKHRFDAYSNFLSYLAPDRQKCNQFIIHGGSDHLPQILSISV